MHLQTSGARTEWNMGRCPSRSYVARPIFLGLFHVERWEHSDSLGWELGDQSGMTRYDTAKQAEAQ